ncbi:hypothetical protein HYZ78_04045 [Candidatus Microgenomates bacterium]|nr:hypothetical protein [Candidatus Microgenomates bacterium]
MLDTENLRAYTSRMNISENERKWQETSTQARSLLREVSLLSSEAAKGDLQAGIKLIYTLVPNGQDNPPEVPVTDEILSALPNRQAAAIKVAYWFSAEFNRNFGAGTSGGKILTEDNERFGYFVQSLGRTVRELLPRNDHWDTPQAGQYMGETVLAHLRLVSWAEEQLTAPRA